MGKNGVLFTPNEVDDLVKKIAHLLDEPESRHRIGSAGKQTILERFTMTKMMDQMEGFLQEVVSASITMKSDHIESSKPSISRITR